MKNLNDNHHTRTALPVFRVRLEFPELDRMIAAMLEGHFRASDDDAPALLISGGEGCLILTSGDGSREERLERPVSAETLIEAALRVAAGALPGGFSADAERHLAVLGEISVKLSPTEFRMFSAMLENGGFIAADELSQAVWGRSDRNLCAVYISYLRRKLDTAFGDGTLITASGKGYRLRDAKYSE